MSLIEKIDAEIVRLEKERDLFPRWINPEKHDEADAAVKEAYRIREIIISEQKEPCKPKPLTIGDKIRTMNNNEIKDVLVEFQLRGRYKKGMMSVSEIVDYLNQPYTDTIN